MSFGYVNEGSAVMRGPMVTQLLDQFLSLTDWGELDYLILDMPPGTGDIQLTLSQRLDISAAVIVTTPQELSFVDVERGVEMFDTVNVPCVAVVENMAYFEKEKSSGSGSHAVVEIDAEVLEERFLEALLQKDDDGVMGMDEKAAVGMAGELVKIVQQNIQNAATSANSNTDDDADGDNEMEQIRIFGPGHKRRLSEQFGIEHSYSIPLLGQIAQNGDSGTPFILEHPNSPQADIYRQLASSVVSEIAKAKSKGAKRPTVTFNSEEHMLQVNDIGSEESGEAVKDEDEDEDKDSTISPAELRRECRCAACVEELTGKQILDPTSVRETIKPLNMYPTGNYALSVDWSDGHKSLYPYRQIRSLLSAKKEVVEQ